MASAEDSYIGKQIGGDYRITAKINHGAFGSVYQARHIVFDDQPIVAIKILNGVVEGEADKQRFFQEARLLRLLRHRYILPVLGAGIQEGVPYIVMEYASRGSLRDRLLKQAGQPLPQEEAITILKQIGEALHTAHQEKVVHRDLKPDNILFNYKGEAVLADFGIAAALFSGTMDIGQGGTPAYMAPEQFQGMVSPKSDQYALGCIAYELVTGRHPFDIKGVDVGAVWYQHSKVIPDTPKKYNSTLADSTAQAILIALAKDRSARYPDIATFIAAIAMQKNAQQWFDEGNVFASSGKYEDAIRMYKEAISLNPNYTGAYNNTGLSLSSLQRYEEAITLFDEAIRSKPEEANAYNNKGNALDELQRYEEAIRMYDEAIRWKPNFTNAYFNRGNTFLRMKKYEEAFQTYDLAIRLKPDFAAAHQGKGIALEGLGRIAEANQAFAKAEELGN